MSTYLSVAKRFSTLPVGAMFLGQTVLLIVVEET